MCSGGGVPSEQSIALGQVEVSIVAVGLGEDVVSAGVDVAVGLLVTLGVMLGSGDWVVADGLTVALGVAEALGVTVATIVGCVVAAVLPPLTSTMMPLVSAATTSAMVAMSHFLLLDKLITLLE
jgi:hypothetical protein